MASHGSSSQFDSSTIFEAIKTSFDINEEKIVALISFDVVSLIPWLSEAGLMETELRKLLSRQDVVTSYKANHIINRVRRKGAFGYLKFLSILHKNRCHPLHRKLWDDILKTAEEIDAFGHFIGRSCELFTSYVDFSRVSLSINSTELETTSSGVSAVDVITSRLPVHHPINVVDDVDTCKESIDAIHTPRKDYRRRLYETKDAVKNYSKTCLYPLQSDESLSRFGVNSHSVCMMVMEFCQSNGSVEKKYESECVFREAMWKLKNSIQEGRDRKWLMSNLRLQKTIFLAQVLDFYLSGKSGAYRSISASCWTPEVHSELLLQELSDRIEDLVSSIDRSLIHEEDWQYLQMTVKKVL